MKKIHDRKKYMKKYWEQYYINNKDKEIERKKQYRKNNSEKIREYMKQYRKNNPEKIKKYIRLRSKKRWRTNLRFNLNRKISRAVNHSLKGNKQCWYWEEIVGYTINQFKKRLQKTIPKNYCWQDYIDGKLHIDHIIPISAFNFNSADQIDFKRCWALKNLRLLPAKENIIKSDKLNEPFQPALKI